MASSFAEGSSLSVTRSNAVRLLKDFDIEWWFAPLRALGDMGSAELVAELLVLQRQGEFDKKETTSVISNAKITGNVLEFDFLTPLAQSYNRKTIVKAIFNNNKLDVAWISALTGGVESDYGDSLYVNHDYV